MSQRVSNIRGYAKYVQVKQAMYEQIQALGAAPGDKLWTEAELIRTYGVSVTTIRKALEEMVREGVVERRVGKGTFLKAPSPGEKQTSNRVLLLSWNPWEWMSSDAYYGDIVRAVEETLSAHEYQLVISARNWGQDREAEFEEIRLYKPAAVVFPYSRISMKPYLMALSALGYPVLVINQFVEGYQGAQIYFDDFHGGQLVAGHLMKKKHRSIAMITGPNDSPAGSQRVEGFGNILQRKGCTLAPERIAAGNYSEDSGYHQMGTLLQRDRDFTAVFCCNDMMAYGAIHRLQESHLRVPQDVAVAGFGNFTVSSFYHPKLTTIHMDLPWLGEMAAQWILDVVQHPEKANLTCRQELPVQLIEGETT